MYRRVNADLYNYLINNILSQYKLNDSGHDAEHINYVINRCFKFFEQFSDIDINILFTAAVFHDIGHHVDKANHEKVSAQYFYSDIQMKKYFTDEERISIKEAIEDHRASSKTEPRSIYGKILSSADRSTDVNEFLKRTHAFTLKHQPGSTYEEIINRGFNHTKEKYGSCGYAKNYVIDEEYNKFRAEINELLKSKKAFEAKYRKINHL